MRNTVTAADGPEDTQGAVGFVARRTFDGRAHRLVEISRFVRERGHRVYQDGEIESR